MSFPNVTLFTKPDCQYCDRAKAVLRQEGIPYQEHDVTLDPHRSQASVYLSGARTVPQIFVGRYHINSAEDLEALERTGRLRRLIQNAFRKNGTPLTWDDLPPEELQEGAQDLVLRSYIPPSDGSRTSDQEAWPILHFYKTFFGFWPNTYAYLHHWPEAYKLTAMGLIMSAVGAARQTIGNDMMFTTAYATSNAHGCSYCQVHSATTGGEHSLDVIEAMERAKQGEFGTDNPFGPFEVALTELAAKATLNQVSTELLDQIKELEFQGWGTTVSAEANIQGAALIAAAFGFLNVFNDLIGLEIEGDWFEQANHRLGIEAGRHGSQDHNPSNLDYELPEGGPSFADMIQRYEEGVGDLETYVQQEFGVMPAWLQAWPRGLRKQQAYVYGELMGNRDHSFLSAELKHLMARVSAIAKDHAQLAALEGFMAYHVAEDKDRALDRIRYCFLAATHGEGSDSLFSEKEQLALQLAWLSAQIPLTTPGRFIKPVLLHYSPKELIQLIVVCSIASMTQRFVAVVRPPMELKVEAFLAEFGLEEEPLALRYPTPIHWA